MTEPQVVVSGSDWQGVEEVFCLPQKTPESRAKKFQENLTLARCFFGRCAWCFRSMEPTKRRLQPIFCSNLEVSGLASCSAGDFVAEQRGNSCECRVLQKSAYQFTLAAVADGLVAPPCCLPDQRLDQRTHKTLGPNCLVLLSMTYTGYCNPKKAYSGVMW